MDIFLRIGFREAATRQDHTSFTRDKNALIPLYLNTLKKAGNSTEQREREGVHERNSEGERESGGEKREGERKKKYIKQLMLYNYYSCV